MKHDGVPYSGLRNVLSLAQEIQKDLDRIAPQKVSVVIQIGNSDDKLSQSWWSDFFSEVGAAIVYVGGATHFSGMSLPDARWQNACWVAELEFNQLENLKIRLANLAYKYTQDSIALVVGKVEFIKGSKK